MSTDLLNQDEHFYERSLQENIIITVLPPKNNNNKLQNVIETINIF